MTTSRVATGSERRVPARNLGDEHADTSPPLSSSYTSPTNITNSTSTQHLLQHQHHYHQQHHTVTYELRRHLGASGDYTTSED